MNAAERKLRGISVRQGTSSRNLGTLGAMRVEWSVSPFVYPFLRQKKGHDHMMSSITSAYPEATSEIAFFSVSEYVLKFSFNKKKGEGADFFLIV